MKEEDYKKIVVTVMVLALFVLAFIIIRPIILAVAGGLILAYIFRPIHRRVTKLIKSKNISALLIVLGIIIILLLLAIFLIPIVARQTLNIYLFMQDADLSSILQKHFPTIFRSLSAQADFSAAASSFFSDLASVFLRVFQQLVFNIPFILLQSVIVIFTFFFLLRDYDEIKDYFMSVSPFPKDIQNRFYNKFEQITNSILYGQLVVGLAQGIVAGVGYFLFGVPNALLLTLLTTLVGIIPVIGPWLVWIPVDLYLFLNGHTGAAIGLLVYGLLVINWVDTFVRPMVVSKMAKMNPAIALIGMIGGFYVFGVMGLIIGPLILAYLFLLAEFYKERRVKSILIEEEKNK